MRLAEWSLAAPATCDAWMTRHYAALGVDPFGRIN
jgi:hypothetical protein